MKKEERIKQKTALPLVVLTLIATRGRCTNYEPDTCS